MQFRYTGKFSKELKKFTKKYRSLPDDVVKLEKILLALPEGNKSKHWNQLHISPDGHVKLFKVRLSCASLKGESLFRVIYAYHIQNDNLALIDFIELYYKGNQANEDRGRIEEYLKNKENLF